MTITEIYSELNSGNYAVVEAEIIELNRLYRKGDSPITDPEYDKLLDAFKVVMPSSKIFDSGVIEDDVDPDRAESLKYPMYSLDKEKFIVDIHKWLKNKGLPLSTILICTAKYDGISILKDEWNQEAWSRGDGLVGETMHTHYARIGDKAIPMKIFSIGELLFPKHEFATHTFLKNDGTPYKNARNMMGGLKNSDTISDDLQYVHHVRYGFATEDFTMNKSEELDFISTHIRPVPYRKFRADELDTDELTELFIEWGVIYDLDGLVFDIDDKDIRKKLGRESNNNPAYARAFKNPDWATKTETGLRCSNEYPTGIEWNISKNAYFAPVVLLDPFDVDGVTVSRATGNNAKFIKDNNIGGNCRITCIRSGSVIPKIIDVVKAGVVKLPTVCPHCDSTLVWNKSGVHIMCPNKDCPEVKFLKLAFFFLKFKIDGFAEKTIRKIFDAGYDTVGKILSMSISDIEVLDGMAKSSATKILKGFDEKIKNTSFEYIGHASGCFENLGSKKLKKIYDGIQELYPKSQSVAYLKEDMKKSQFNMLSKLLKHDDNRKKIFDVLLDINGMSDKSVEYFLDGIVNFSYFIEGLPITIEEEKVASLNDFDYTPQDFKGRSFVFTGVRDEELKNFIIACGGDVKDSVSKTTTDLVAKTDDTSSAKAQKAIAFGAKVWQIDKLKEFFK